MLSQTEKTRRVSPGIDIDMDAVSARLADVAEVALCPDCEPAATALAADVAELLGELTRLYGALMVTRRQSANRLAAIRATVRAESEGENDPLEFLRDEIADSPGRQQLPGQSRRWCR